MADALKTTATDGQRSFYRIAGLIIGGHGVFELVRGHAFGVVEMFLGLWLYRVARSGLTVDEENRREQELLRQEDAPIQLHLESPSASQPGPGPDDSATKD